MSERGHKSKRNLQDPAVDLPQVREALNYLEALKEKLEEAEEELEETQEELDTISYHILKLENILKGAKKSQVTFSMVAAEDLKKAGVTGKWLHFEPAKVTELTKGLTTNAEAEIADLHSRMKKIYARVNSDYDPGSHMIIDAILLALAEIASTENRGVAILPGMRVAQDGVQISHPVSGYELWLSGTVDYAVIEYDDVGDYKERLLAPGRSREDAFDISRGRLLLVEAKREQSLLSLIPKGVSQAIALLRSANLPEVRFCLSDGHAWIFFIVKLENGMLTYYESAIRRLSRYAMEKSDLPLREIVQLIREWLRPTKADLFTLE